MKFLSRFGFSLFLWSCCGSSTLLTTANEYYKPYLGHIHQKKAKSLRMKLDQILHEKHRTNDSKKQGKTMEAEEEEENQNLFTPAQPLAYFQDINNIKKDGDDDDVVFEWENAEHVQAGEQTCGYLYPKLGSDSNEPYPRIKVKFCMRFANQQPARKGNMMVHCGGPGALSSCGSMYNLGQDNLNNYNFITFDQRGMGMSRPSFAHEECTYGTKFEGGKLVLTGMSSDFIDATNASSTKFFLDQQKKRLANCWACGETCGFHLEATDGSDRTYHFLEHSGTRQVAEDMELFRKIVTGSDTVSLYGISYATQIMATYATMFPNHVDKFVVDSNMPPQPDLYSFASIIAENNHQRSSYASYTCEMRNNTAIQGEKGSCNIDLNYCYQTVFHQYEKTFGTIGYMDFQRTFFAEFTQESVLDNFKHICDAAQEKDETKFLSALIGIEAEEFDDPIVQSCLPGIYTTAVNLIENHLLGEIPDIFDNFYFNLKNNKNQRAAYSAYILAFLTDYETCVQFEQNSKDKSTQEALVYDLWSQEYGHLYNKEDDRHRKLTAQDCTGPTYAHALYPFLVKSCLDGSITTADDENDDKTKDDIIIDNYSVLMGEPAVVPQTMVLGQSMTGSSYDDQHVIQLVREIYNKYGGEFYGEYSATNFLFWYSLGYQWPKAQPIPPAGNIRLKGIVAGQLYDSVTAYKFTQEMKKAFPSTTLITSQWSQHGFSSTKAQHHGDLLADMGDENYQESCQPYINRYFEHGYVEFVDGHVCENKLPDTFLDF